jgi:molybdopterin-guanine dinucleotide biosynthesis protein A
MSGEREVTLAVIAGGAGSRMGGPKCRMVIGGKPVLIRLMDRIAWEGPRVLSSGVDGMLGAEMGPGVFDRIVKDERPGSGPLAAILGALRECATEWMVCVPVDMPGLEGLHLRWLVERGVERQCSCAMLRPKHRGVEPFPLLLRREAIAGIESLWAGGGRAVRDLGGVAGAVVLDAPEQWGQSVWVNLNTPEDVEAFERPRDTMRSSGRVGQEGGEA